MATGKYYLGIDCGTTVTKAALYSENGAEIAVCSEETRAMIPRPGHVERDMDAMRDSVFSVTCRLLTNENINGAEITAVACCGHGKGLYLWGEDDRPVRNGILSSDNRAYAYPVKWEMDGTAERVYALSLQKIMPCQPPALLAWLKDNEPGIIEKTKWVFECKDFARFLLTGEAYAELSDYSGANLVNLNTLRYDSRLLDCFGLGEIINKLPPLRKATDICGYITKDVAAATGLLAGTPVAGGMFDIDACAVGVGASEDRLCVIAGTWSINEYVRSAPVTTGSIAMNSVFCDCENFLIEESSATSAANLEWFIRTLLPELKAEAEKAGRSIYSICDEYVASVTSVELCPVFLPFLYASNVHPNAEACLVGVTSYHTRRHIVKAVYEGIAFCHKHHIERLLASMDHLPTCIRLAGGMAKSAVWCQMLADVTGIPVETVEANETGTLGLAITTAVAMGKYPTIKVAAAKMVMVKTQYEPIKKNIDDNTAQYRIYRKVTDALDVVWDAFQQ